MAQGCGIKLRLQLNKNFKKTQKRTEQNWMACKAMTLTLRGTLRVLALWVLLNVSWKTCCQWHIARRFEATLSLLCILIGFRLSPSLTAARLHTAVEKLMLFRAVGACECISDRREQAVCTRLQSERLRIGCVLCFGFDKPTVSKISALLHICDSGKVSPGFFSWQVKLSCTRFLYSLI